MTDDDLSPADLLSTRLRKGCRCHQIQSMLYIDADQEQSSTSGLGQVTLVPVSDMISA